jgi:hypothetical protein
MEPWCHSDVIHAFMESLIKRNLLPMRTEASKWVIPGDEDALAPPDSYAISFIPFHERRLMAPPYRFLQGLLHHYKIELQHLNPNGIQHIAAFVALCEGYLGVEPYFELWKYFFVVSLQKKKKNKAKLLVLMGSACIHLHGGRAGGYIPITLTKSNKGWHKLWFYLKNDDATPCWSSSVV